MKMFNLKILVFLVFVVRLKSFIVGAEVRIPLAKEDLGVCGRTPEAGGTKTRNRNLVRRKNRTLMLNLTIVDSDVESLNVRIVGGEEVKEPYPW